MPKSMFNRIRDKLFDSMCDTLTKTDTWESNDFFARVQQHILKKYPYAVNDDGELYNYRDKSCVDVVLPNGIVGIKEGAFRDCDSLDSICVSPSVVHIDDKAFTGCNTLRSFSMLDSITPRDVSIGHRAFMGCQNLVNVRISSDVKLMGNSVFYGCTNLKSVELSKNMGVIPDDTFGKCYNLDTVIMPAVLHDIGYRAFCDCESLSHIELPDTLRVIHADAFSNTDIKRVCIPKDVMYIGDNAFANCSELNSFRNTANRVSMKDVCDRALKGSPVAEHIKHTKTTPVSTPVIEEIVENDFCFV